MAAKAGELEDGDVVGEYRIEGKVGSGGMGTVYGAVHPVIGKRAAIKVLRPELCTSTEAIERFVQEARAVNQIGHPNIVDVFGFGTLPDGRSYFAMERLSGESLAERVERAGLPLGLACHVLERTCRALEAAHAKGITHRDLKPDNVFLVEVPDELPVVKLLDFGIAKLSGGDDQRAERTRTGVMMGTPLYMAPEQARGHAMDHRVDVYALGVMAFELLTGELPFTADNAMDIIAKHLTEPPRAPSSTGVEVEPELDALVLAMLAKDPDERPALRQVRVAVSRVRAKESGLPAEDTTPVPKPRSKTAAETAPTAMAVTPTVSLTRPAPAAAPVETLPTMPTMSASPAPRGRGRWIAAAVVGAAVAGVGVFFAVRDRGARESAPIAAPAPAQAQDSQPVAQPPREPVAEPVADPVAVPIAEPAPAPAAKKPSRRGDKPSAAKVAAEPPPKPDPKPTVEATPDVNKPVDEDAVVDPFRKKKPATP